MKLKITILLVSLLSATLVISGGYGYWQKDLTIKGNITVVRPDETNGVQQVEQPKPSESTSITITDPGKGQKDQEGNNQDNPQADPVGTAVEKDKEKATQSPEIAGTSTTGVLGEDKSSEVAKDSNKNTEPTTVNSLDDAKASTAKIEEKK